jgi:tetratricopeptide (TPR) repeat protein
MGYPNQALKWLNSVKDRYNDNKKYRLILANAHSEAGNTDVALKIYNSLIDENPYDAEAWLGIAKCYYKEEQFEDAIEPCEYAIAANEDYAEAYSMIANSYLQLENFEKAEEYFKIAIERHSIKEDCGHAFLGLCYTNEEKYSLGREEFETALTLQEENSGMELFIDDIMLNYAICLSETDYRDRACEIIEELLRNNEYDIPVMIAATKIFAGNNRIDEARELAEKIYPLVKDSDNPEDILTLIEIMNDLGMRKESLQASLSLINLLGDDAILFRMLASGHLIEGDFENFCRYNIQATPRYTTEEAYDIHLEACRRLRKEPMDYDEFESMIEETTKRLEEEKLKR